MQYRSSRCVVNIDFHYVGRSGSCQTRASQMAAMIEAVFR